MVHVSHTTHRANHHHPSHRRVPDGAKRLTIRVCTEAAANVSIYTAFPFCDDLKRPCMPRPLYLARIPTSELCSEQRQQATSCRNSRGASHSCSILWYLHLLLTAAATIMTSSAFKFQSARASKSGRLLIGPPALSSSLP